MFVSNIDNLGATVDINILLQVLLFKLTICEYDFEFVKEDLSWTS